MAQLSNDCFIEGGELLTLKAARALLAERVIAITGLETRALIDALGAVLREDVIAPLAVPSADNSAVDGYAIAAADLLPDRATRLPVTGRAAAGHPLGRAHRRGEAVRIFTGALMPEGADTVMMQEDAREEDGFVTLAPGLKPGSNRRLAGEDLAKGAKALSAGQRLRPQDLGLAAALGRTQVKVSQPLSVVLFSTGDELAEPGQPLKPGQIYDSNRTTLGALLQKLGCQVKDGGRLPDQPSAIRAALAEASQRHHLILTSGGVSLGEEDHVKQAVEAEGSLYFWRLAIKPGRPLALGQVGLTPFVGMPGNPVAAVVTFVAIVQPLIDRLTGATAAEPRAFPVTADFSYRKKAGRLEWLRVLLEGDAMKGWRAKRFPREGAGVLSSLVESDGFVVLPEEVTGVAPGDSLAFTSFRELAS